ncbi:hypothetical protein, partial [Stenotrophomonas maltophilia group sp. RNC7]|uniref:hypothetical protein n=1 Tax=Stenotrophomonas maltophilia group sp. RNC7 TaxID=3071467 RepID=UPI0027E0EEC2
AKKYKEIEQRILRLAPLINCDKGVDFLKIYNKYILSLSFLRFNYVKIYLKEKFIGIQLECSMADVRCFMNRKRIFKNIAGISLICMGIAVMLYPALKEHYYDAKQKAALSSYREAIHSIQVTDEDIMEELFVNPT